MMKVLTYWISKVTFISMIFFLCTTIWILIHPMESATEGMVTYPWSVLLHFMALMFFAPAAYMSHIIHRDWDE